MAVQLFLLVLGKITAGWHRGRPLDQCLVKGHADGVAFLACADQGDKGWGRAHGAGLK